ncbi:cell filamentation protein Fic [Enterovibrio norvegicus FF-33]|uniref:Fic/DOC family protein n=1 Tax=Enterovibrio norvegicus TaxID=188144 RepID=UPI000378B3FC|nr:Fic family protein [Enterovibrio norvegicus]OEE65841.1 cell filamentation protein Fic [Enterovibrio norvegicus FF-33]
MDKYTPIYGDPYCYPGTDVLINNFDERNIYILEELEVDLTEAAAQKIQFRHPPYNLRTMEQIHASLFSDLYPWAGKLRTCDITKGDTRFCNCNFIELEATKLFAALAEDKWLKGLPIAQFAEKLAEHYCEFNLLHPFREGNGRTQRYLFDFIANSNGYVVMWGEIERKEWLNANVMGVFDPEPMAILFRRAINLL